MKGKPEHTGKWVGVLWSVSSKLQSIVLLYLPCWDYNDPTPAWENLTPPHQNVFLNLLLQATRWEIPHTSCVFVLSVCVCANMVGMERLGCQQSREFTLASQPPVSGQKRSRETQRRLQLARLNLAFYSRFCWRVCSYLLFVTLERAEGMSCPVISCYRYVTCTPEYSSSTKLTEPQRMHKTSAWDPVMAALSLMMSAIC